jgi:hypothetical protein
MAYGLGITPLGQLERRTFSAIVAGDAHTLSDGSSGIAGGCFVAYDSAGEVELNGPDKLIAGVLLEDTPDGFPGTIVTQGDVQLVIEEPFAANERFYHGEGAGATVSPGSGAGSGIGIVLEAGNGTATAAETNSAAMTRVLARILVAPTVVTPSGGG